MTSETTRRDFMKSAAKTVAAAMLPDYLQGENPAGNPLDIMQHVLTRSEAENLMLHKMDKHIINDDKVVHKLMELGIVKNPKWDMFIFRRSLAGLSVFKSGFCGNVVKEFGDDSAWNKERKGEAMTVENVQRRFWDRASAHVAEEVIKIRTKKKRGMELSMTEKGENENFPILFGPLDQLALAPFDMDTLNVKDDKAVEAIARRSPKTDFRPVFQKLGISFDILHITEQDLRDIGVKVEQSHKDGSGQSWVDRSASSGGSAAYIKQ